MTTPAKPAGDDRCAKSGCGLTREWHRVSNYGGHAFAEPEPAATVVAREVPGLPGHLRDNAPYRSCVKCGRKSWSAREWARGCEMPQPNGDVCAGRFTTPTPDSSDDAAARAIWDRLWSQVETYSAIDAAAERMGDRKAGEKAAGKISEQIKAAVREALAAGEKRGRRLEREALDHDNRALVAELAGEIQQATKTQPHMGGLCRRVHGDEENKRIARAVLRALKKRGQP